jgi:uracil DNA glycosylase
MQILQKWKKFLEKELHHNFMQLLAQELVMTKHTTYPKVSYRRFIDFEILQI